MLKIYQQTVKDTINFKGVGLHTGKNSTVTVMPAESDQGIVFKRVDLKKNNIIKACYKNVSNAKLCTTLENDKGVKVSTVEHLLAALYIAEIDNATIEIDNVEVPIMDGSAKDFLTKLKHIGAKTLPKKKKYLRIVDKVEMFDGQRKISIEPGELSFEVNFQLDYKNKIIGNQKNTINFQTDNLQEVVDSRTFCLLEDVEKIKKNGLAKGGSLENALVVNDKEVLNKDGLRNDKEFVNHKILDLAGDFFLSGFSVLGKVNCYQGGHELSNLFLRKLLNSNSAFESLELTEITISKETNSYQPIKSAVNA